ncbi:MAG TPA: hypothetical protein VKR55_12185 [Bradyrhizobium sp.]|uniref:hypothetical protein n=1 Tax=Bradyrhizobium sp. TaxID=376 RepID=UPI002BF96324|nr:hypothetical protein [Bradyrhizobium sp.]HLZ02898.1 hypothetical protein [Bradyrhizobium sp.]
MKSISDHAQFTSRQVRLKVKLEVSKNLRTRIEQLELWRQDSITVHAEKMAANLVGVDPDTILPLIPTSLTVDWSNLRDAKAATLREAAAGLRRASEELATLIGERVPVRECETEVNDAKTSLTLDLDKFFRNAELYRDGVFSHTTKESIATLGIGARLDALESEFTESDRTAYIRDTMQSLFPDFTEISAKALTNFAAIEKDLRPLVSNLDDLKIPSPTTASRDVRPLIDREESQLQASITSQLEEDVQHLGRRLDIQLSSAIAEASRQLDADLRSARRRRRWKYALAVAGPAALVFVGYLFYAYLNRDVPQDSFNAVLWNLVAGVIFSGIATGVAGWRDEFPKNRKRLLDDARSMLKGKILAIVDDALKSHEFSVLDDTKLPQRLSEACANIVSVDPDGWDQIAAERLDALRRHETEYRRLRNEYEQMMEVVFERTSSYFSDASKNLERLNEVAARVKKAAIEPSFELLAQTKASLEDVKHQIHSVEFNA